MKRMLIVAALLAGCAHGLNTLSERELACDEACACVADKTHTLLSSSQFDGFVEDTCTCWTMGDFGERKFATVPRTMPPGACE